MTTRRMITAIHELARQDADRGQPMPESLDAAERILAGWLDAAGEAGDADTCTAIRGLGLSRAAEHYADARRAAHA